MLPSLAFCLADTANTFRSALLSHHAEPRVESGQDSRGSGICKSLEVHTAAYCQDKPSSPALQTSGASCIPWPNPGCNDRLGAHIHIHRGSVPMGVQLSRLPSLEGRSVSHSKLYFVMNESWFKTKAVSKVFLSRVSCFFFFLESALVWIGLLA